MAFRQIISTLTNEGKEILGPDILLFHYPENSIVNGSLLTVESNHFAVLKSRGAILNVYDTGQFVIETPEHPLFGGFQKTFFGGQSPWQYEVLYINRAKLMLKAKGTAYSKEMAELEYDVNCYIHVDTKEDSLKLVQHMPVAGHFLKSDELNNYATPVIEQAINQIVQVTPLEEINEHIKEITELVKGQLQGFLDTFGITLNDVKVVIYPKDERMKQLISLRAFGLSEIDAVRYYTAMLMAEKGVVSAPNMAIGQPFNVGNVITDSSKFC
jgi:membrane protease subunit (stomatin/prohibitin family)